MTECTVSVAHDPACTVVRVGGEVDMATAPKLKAVLVGLDMETTRVVLDMRDTTFIDSSGLSVLVAAQIRCTDFGRQLHLVIDHPHLLRVFAVTGLLDVFAVHTDVTSACAAVAA